MTYADLLALIIDESHRPDLSSRIPSYVARSEAMIARELRATENIAQLSLLDADRISADSPIYKLPEDFLEDRSVIVDGRLVRKVSRDALMRASRSGNPLFYALRSDATSLQIEFRATPGPNAEIELEYFARLPKLVLPGDTNRLLNTHEAIYLNAALFLLYTWTQDIELAQASYDTWLNAVTTLNEQAGRYLGGTLIAPNLNLGHTPVGRGY